MIANGIPGPSQGELDLQRLEMCAVQDGHAIQIDAFVLQL